MARASRPRGRSALQIRRRPVRPEDAFDAGCATRIRPRWMPSVSADVTPRELRVDDHDVAPSRASRYLARASRASARSPTRGSPGGTRSWNIVARMPARCGGYIQSVKWRTSTVRRAPRPRAPRDARAGPRRVGERDRPGGVGRPRAVERQLDASRPADAGGRERDELVPAAGRLDACRPSEPRM